MSNSELNCPMQFLQDSSMNCLFKNHDFAYVWHVFFARLPTMFAVSSIPVFFFLVCKPGKIFPTPFANRGKFSPVCQNFPTFCGRSGSDDITFKPIKLDETNRDLTIVCVFLMKIMICKWGPRTRTSPKRRSYVRVVDVSRDEAGSV